MRLAILLFSAAVVFVAMLLFDTAALLRLTAYCVSGGCGVRPLWIAIGAGVAIAVAVLLSFRKRGSRVKSRKKAFPRKKPPPPGKPKRSKP